ARQKGLSAEQYSLVFGVYSLSQITFSIIVGRSLTKIGPKFIVLAGLFLTGGSTILFGCLDRSPGGPIFFWLCMAVRAVEGAGFAAYLTSSLAVIVRTFPTNPGYYVSFVVYLPQASGSRHRTEYSACKGNQQRRHHSNSVLVRWDCPGEISSVF
ncbi:MFS-type transporter SLC18B1, partial [Araneus ventricosus]